MPPFFPLLKFCLSLLTFIPRYLMLHKWHLKNLSCWIWTYWFLKNNFKLYRKVASTIQIIFFPPEPFESKLSTGGLIASKCFSVWFPASKEVLLYYNTNIKIMKLAVVYHYHLILSYFQVSSAVPVKFTRAKWLSSGSRAALSFMSW